MKFLKESQTLVINKSDAIYDVVVQCWCVPPKNQKQSYYEMPNTTTTVLEFEGFLDEVIFATLMNRLIDISNKEKDKTHIYRVYIGWLLLFQIQNDLDPKDATNFNTMLKNFQSRSQIAIPNDFQFSKINKYENNIAEEILNEIILYDLIRAENGILKPTKHKKQGTVGKTLKRISQRGSQILINAAETARQHSPLKSRPRSLSLGTSPSKLQISAPIMHDDQEISDNDQDSVTDDEATEQRRLIPPTSTTSKQPSYNTGRVAEPKPPSSAPHAAFYSDSKGNRSRSGSQHSNNMPSASNPADPNNALPPIQLLFTTLYDKETGEIKIDCPNETCAKVIQNKFGPTVARRMFCFVYITPQNWLTHKAQFIANLEPEFKELLQFIERTYCSSMGIPYKPPTTNPLPITPKSLNDDPDEQEEESSKCCFCF